jgi:hypothetical protein
MLARRHPLHALSEPLYELVDVPRFASADTSLSVRVTMRSQLIECLGEIVLLANRAADDFSIKCLETGQVNIHPGKPLGLEYMADRMEIDDPLWGWMVRSNVPPALGWLQGFVTVTTFTTWQRWFRWDSLSEEAGVVPYDDAPNVHADPVAAWCVCPRGGGDPSN